MYLYKDLHSLSTRNISLAEYLQRFSFLPYIHRDPRQRYLDSRSKEISWLADIAASVTAQLLSKSRNDAIVKQALRCCRDILLSKGYLETNLYGMHNEATSSPSVAPFILVPGCQTDSILESRVDAALQLISSIHTNRDLVFIGYGPPLDPVRIPDESDRMMTIYEDRLRKSVLTQSILCKIRSVRCFTENSSKTTSENIKMFFQSGFMQQKTDYRLYLVSSTFHLLRFAKECEGYLHDNPIANIKQIVLIGADDINHPSEISMSGNYIKFMFYDIYTFLFQDEEKKL